jgi:type VI secretion system protein ImpB
MASGQGFIQKNRAPRVQINYDVEVYGAQKKVQLPFVMGVWSDLSGKSEEPLPKVDDRKMVEFNSDNFNDRIKAIKPRAAFTVPNTLSGEGNVQVDMTFQSMEDFSPAAVAKNVGGLKDLMESRRQLSNLLSYMDGKAGAEELLGKILQDPALLKALAAKAKDAAPEAAAAPEAEKE